MNNSSSDSELPGEGSREELLAALFADLVIRQTQMALMFLGQMPLPQTEERKVDLDAARMFIDQLEMLETKTRGNLTKPEEQLLRQSLTKVRLTFVEVSEQPAEPAAARQPAAVPSGEPKTESSSAPAVAGDGTPGAPPGDEESKVKFSKKY